MGTFTAEISQIFVCARVGSITLLQLFTNKVRCDFHGTPLQTGAGHPQ